MDQQNDLIRNSLLMLLPFLQVYNVFNTATDINIISLVIDITYARDLEVKRLFLGRMVVECL
uniref:Uncharacterized protein n=1 Tax=Romanomermis culicivorax TaxID=13658 RepID=A0A915KAK7_ROMCU